MLREGQTLSHYRLARKIGQGGMGEVWQATDVRLDREVALKFLPEAITHDGDRLDRFVREAKFLASLNHPGIATIHSIEEHEGLRFLVMELVPGHDLAEVLESGPLRLADALDVALQIARAVETAHEQGVVHRDLKPANVKRAPSGQIKVLDFGLAKIVGQETSSADRAVSMSPTLTSAGTLAGVILGTAAYMSPEQARGRPIDKRSDIWSFGVLLYELLTGGNPFRGDTVADSVGAILHRDPDLDALPPETPGAIRRLLRRCLTRDRSHRLHDIADVRIELEDAIANPEAEAVAPPAPEPSATRPAKLPWIALAVLVPLVALAAWWIGSRPQPPAPRAVRQFELVPDQEIDEVELSPDGTRLAYRVKNDVFVRSLDSLDARIVSQGAEGRTLAIFWSPDSRSVGLFKHGGEIRRIDLDGSAPTVLATTDQFLNSSFWSVDGHIYFTVFQSGIHRLPASGGALELVLKPREDLIDYHGMVVVPDGRGLLTIPHLQSGDHREILFETPGGQARVLYESDAPINGLRYSTSGHLLYQRDENPRGLWALPFSRERLEVTGSPFLVVPDLATASVSDAGDLVYAQTAIQSGKRKQQVVWADRTGTIVERLDMPLYEAMLPVASPGGSKLAVVAKGIGRPATGKANLWVIDLERRTSTKLTEEGVGESHTGWSADGSRITFLEEARTPGENDALVAIRADGSGERETVLEADIFFVAELARDWSLAAFMTGSVSEKDGTRIALQVPGDPSTREIFVDGPDQDMSPVIHPDGNWIAYVSGDFVTMDTYVQPFPGGKGRWKVSVGTGGFPFWSPDGRRLYYVRDDSTNDSSHLLEVAFDGSGPEPVLGEPIELFSFDDSPPIGAAIGVAPDGRFLRVIDEEIPEGEEPPDTQGIVLVENWLQRFAE